MPFSKTNIWGAIKHYPPSLLIIRIYLVMSISISILTAIFDPSSMLGVSVIVTDAPVYMLWFAFAVGVLAKLDIIINDLLPDKYNLHLSSNHRHVIYMALALISFSLSVSLITTYAGPYTVARLWLDGIVATVVAFLDIVVRRGFSGSSTYIQSN